MFSKSLVTKAKKILKIAEKKKLKITCAESCTGGLLSALLTEISGASNNFERGFVTYSNSAKKEMLKVKEKTLKAYGAVSEEVAKEMAIGAQKNAKADIAISITGIAGPDGGSVAKPVGLVYIAVANREKVIVKRFNFCGTRSKVRSSAINQALEMMIKYS